MRLGGPQNSSGRDGEEEKNSIIVPAGNWTAIVQQVP